MQAQSESRRSLPAEDPSPGGPAVDLTPSGERTNANEQNPDMDAGYGSTAAPSAYAPPSTRHEHARSRTSNTTATTTPLLEKFLSRVKMLRRLRALPIARQVAEPGAQPTVESLRVARSSVPASKRVSAHNSGVCRPELESEPSKPEPESTVTLTATSEMFTVAPSSNDQNTSMCQAMTKSLHCDSRSVLSTASFDCIFANLDSSAQKYKDKDLRPFCEQLERLLDNIHSMPDLNHLIYNYPSILQNKLDKAALKLHSMLLEARAAHLRILQVKHQKRAVQKGAKALEELLTLIKDEEAIEMENYIALYDKSLMTRWEKIRSSTQEDIVESFLHDIKGKQKALDYLHTLATNKLNQLRSHGKQTPTEQPKPISLNLRKLSVGSALRASSGRWRNKHHERAPKAPFTPHNQDINTSIQIHPTSSAGGPSNLTINPDFVGTSGGTTSTSSSPITFEPVSSSLIPMITPVIHTNVVTSNVTDPPTTNTPERRSAFQALFSDIQNPGTHDSLPINAVMPLYVGASLIPGRIRDRHEESQIETGSLENDIELFTMQDNF